MFNVRRRWCAAKRPARARAAPLCERSGGTIPFRAAGVPQGPAVRWPGAGPSRRPPPDAAARPGAGRPPGLHHRAPFVDQFADDAKPMRQLGPQGCRRKADLQRAVRTDPRRERMRETGVRRGAELRIGDDEARRAQRDHAVASERQREAAAGGHGVYASDDRHRQAAERQHRRMRLVDQLAEVGGEVVQAGLHLADVRADAKGRPFGAKQHRMQRIVPGEALAGAAQPFAEGAVDDVRPCFAAQRQHRHAGFGLCGMDWRVVFGHHRPQMRNTP